MSRHHEPNASHHSARYAERKRAAQRHKTAKLIRTFFEETT
jgi:hypothetical protein